MTTNICKEEKGVVRIAVLLTCHNRCEKTRKCLSSLYAIIKDCSVFLVDDGSTDGTGEMVADEFPMVTVIRGNGDLFWNRGMYTAWKEAIKGTYDYYLLLNDDIELYPFFYNELMECEALCARPGIIVGITEDIDKKNIIYGGTDDKKVLIKPNNNLQDIYFMNGNVVLVPNAVVEKIGILDPHYHHDLGDVDYGLVARRNNIKVVTTRVTIAAGYQNDYCRVRRWNTNIINRFRVLYSPLGSNPRINFYFRKKNFGILSACVYWFYLHLINILPDFIISDLFGNRYIDK